LVVQAPMTHPCIAPDIRMPGLGPLLSPRAIAIVGASNDFGKINGRPLGFLLKSGYTGALYPVNPKYEHIGDLRCYPTVAAIGAPVDLAVIAVPAAQVLAAIADLKSAGVPAAVIFSSGFGEMGTEGRALEAAVKAAAHDAGVRLCGPNCLGLINAFDRVIATFSQYADGPTTPGPVGFVTQSGAFGTAIAALARARGLGLGYFVNTGNEADLSFAEIMDAVLDDPRIRVGAGYLEGVKDGAALVALAVKALQAGKPLVLTKVGRTDAGARAAASHTGSLAGADAVFDGVMRQHGVIRARNEEQMLDIVEALAYCAPPAGRGLGIVTQSGGAAVLMADRAQELGLDVPSLAPATQAALRKAIPGFGTANNPVDVTGQFVADPGLLRDAVLVTLADPSVQVGIVWIQLMEAHVEKLVAIFAEIKARATKPFVVCWVAAPERALQQLHAHGIAVLRGAEPAVDAVAALADHAAARREMRTAVAEEPSVDTSGLPTGVTPSLDAARLLAAFGVPLAEGRLAVNPDEAVAAAEWIGYPVALKIESPDIAHKTEADAVRLNLRTAPAVREAFATTVANARRHNPDARISGMLVQPMAGGDTEMVIGLQNDPAFGPVLMLGLGGIFVEVMRDVVFARAPVTPAEAEGMLGRLQGRRLLDGVRGRPAVDRNAVAAMAAAVSRLGVTLGPRLAELDLNPVRCGPDGAVAVDWLLVLK
jgi:acetyltransferase